MNANNWLHKFFAPNRDTGKRMPARWLRKTHLQVEQLEARYVPTVIGSFIPASGMVPAPPAPTTAMVGAVSIWIAPKTISSGSAGTVIEEDVYLENPNSDNKSGSLDAFNLALTYDLTALAVSSAVDAVQLGSAVPRDWSMARNKTTTPGVVLTLLRSCSLPGVGAGDIVAVFRYVILFVTALDTMPVLIQHVSRLRDIGRRMRLNAN
jgi:hypothetical protein